MTNATAAILCLLITANAGADVLQVGPGKHYATPCMAIAEAKPGDRIEIDGSGVYQGDVCAWKTDDLTLAGVNGRPKLEASGRAAQGRAIWVISGNNTVIEGIEFTGARARSNNGAGILQVGANLTVRHCYFHDNEDGILTAENSSSKILVEYSEFAENGYPDGQSHNIYIGHIGEFTLRFSYSHDARYGHLVKSRAERNFILYNRLTGEIGTSSYELDLPNGGLSYVIGNLIQQGALSENMGIVAYGEERLTNLVNNLYFVNNTVVNHRWNGVFIKVDPLAPPPLVQNNVFTGAGEVLDPPIGKLSHNIVRMATFVDAANFDYRPSASSPARDFGVDPGSANGFSLRPVYQYVHPTCYEKRTTTGAAMDAGAFEFRGGGGASPDCARHGK